MKLSTGGPLHPGILVAALGCALSFSCGGGDNNTLTGLAATFAPTSPTPAAKSVTLQPGTVSGDTFQVRVAVTDVHDFFGAAFSVTYKNTIPDPANSSLSVLMVTFTGMSSSGSFLRETGVATDFRVDSTTTPWMLVIVATRLQQDPPISGVNVLGTRDLLTLTFRVRRATTGSPIDLVAPREVCDSGQPVCTPIGVTWSGGTVVAN